eukprot:10690327-Alexandrium_andersonii.AAC.1
MCHAAASGSGDQFAMIASVALQWDRCSLVQASIGAKTNLCCLANFCTCHRPPKRHTGSKAPVAGTTDASSFVDVDMEEAEVEAELELVEAGMGA